MKNFEREEMFLADFSAIQKALSESRNIAIVGLSPKENRPSNMVGRYLLHHGYRVFPVNPGQSEILGQQCYPSLGDIQQPIDIVDVFRRPEDVLAIAHDAVKVKAKVLWMQEGIVNETAAEVARAAGILVVMDRCIKTDHEIFFAKGD